MDNSGPKQLGHYIRFQRARRGMSARRLAMISGIKQPTLVRLERGEFQNPGPDKLKALARALDVPLADLWSFTDYGLDSELPGPLPFLRAKYRDLPAAELEALAVDVAFVLERHGIDPYGRPAPGEDEAPEPTDIGTSQEQP